jgi:hypothetical protein
MNLIEGALEYAVRMVMAGLPIVLAVLVLWLIVQSLNEKRTTPSKKRGQRAPSRERLA